MGYVGLPLALAFSKKFKVIGYDINSRRINQLIKGFDSTQETINFNKQNKNLEFYSDIKNLKKCNILS